MGLTRGATPVRLSRLRPWLARYPNRVAAALLEEGFSEGFRIPFREREGVLRSGNLGSALSLPAVVQAKLDKEVALGRMAGPFSSPPLPNLRVSPLGVVPKREPGQFRMIHHLSFPFGGSVNDDIDPEVCKVYASFDKAVRLVSQAGKGALLAKADVESAFRLLPVHPSCHHLLGCSFQGSFYVDLSLPMGCSISCALFETFSTFIEWVVRVEAGCNSIIHYLDDFLCVGPGGSAICAWLLRTLQWVADVFGVPLAPEKTVGPVTCLSFLGIELDSIAMERRLPADKLGELRDLIRAFLGVRRVTLHQLQSLLGKLNFACRILPMGRVFSRRLARLTAGVKRPHHFIRLSPEVRSDLVVWDSFLRNFNGRALWLDPVSSNEEVGLQTDAAGSVGFGAILGEEWCAGRWPSWWMDSGLTRNLVFLELFPIVVALELWGDSLRNKCVVFHCDNLGVVDVVNNLTASSPPVLRLLRCLVLRCLGLNLSFRARHVPGVRNVAADALSRLQMESFRVAWPAAKEVGSVCPDDLWELGRME
ncbi:LOW QUALITY PROTEIN: uncharacterized protein WCC33_006112 [Rhinophrynus dorsalis]